MLDVVTSFQDFLKVKLKYLMSKQYLPPRGILAKL